MPIPSQIVKVTQSGEVFVEPAPYNKPSSEVKVQEDKEQQVEAPPPTESAGEEQPTPPESKVAVVSGWE